MSTEAIETSHSRCVRIAAVLSRRELLARSGMGLAALALAAVAVDGAAARRRPTLRRSIRWRPAARTFAGKAKRVIHFFANGGPSQVDTFDPKPALAKYAGRELPSGNLPTERKTGAAFPSPFKFQKYGQSGIEVSELFPHVGRAHRRHRRRSARWWPTFRTTSRRCC